MVCYQQISKSDRKDLENKGKGREEEMIHSCFVFVYKYHVRKLYVSLHWQSAHNLHDIKKEHQQ